jgi:hypothetical protein
VLQALVIQIDGNDDSVGSLTYIVLAYNQADAISRVLEENAVRKVVGHIKVIRVISRSNILSTEAQLEELIDVLSS